MTVVQSNSGTSSGTGFTATLPSASTSGNVVLIIVAGNTTVTTLSGWTLRTSQANNMGHYLYEKAAAGDNSWTWANVSGQLTWVALEIQGGTWISGSGQNNINSGSTYNTPNNTPTAGTRIVIASLASLSPTPVARTLSGWTNSFVEVADLCQATADYPMQGVAVLDNITANGSTAYSTTGTYSGTSGQNDSRSALIASYATSAGSALTASVGPDAVGITDGITANLTTGGSSLTASPGPDAVGVTDATATAAARSITVSDTVGITDLGAPQQLDIGLTLSESIGITDASGSTSARALTVSDNVGILDAAATVADRVSDVTDTVGVLDASQADKGQAAAVSDTVGLTDSAATVADRAAVVSDTVGVSDAASVVADRVVTVSDTVGLTDATQADKGQLAGVADDVGISDATATVADRASTPADTVALSDTADTVAVRVLTVTDTAGITDSVQADLTVGGNALTANITDTIGVLDSAATVAVRALTITDTLDLADVATNAAARVLTVSDTAGITDSASADLVVGGNALTATISDAVGVLDATGSTSDRVVIVTDVLGLTDVVALTKVWTVTVTDTIGVLDSATAPGPYKDYTITTGRAVLGSGIVAGRGSW